MKEGECAQRPMIGTSKKSPHTSPTRLLKAKQQYWQGDEDKKIYEEFMSNYDS